jgi:hypothetical protein
MVSQERIRRAYTEEELKESILEKDALKSALKLLERENGMLRTGSSSSVGGGGGESNEGSCLRLSGIIDGSDASLLMPLPPSPGVETEFRELPGLGDGVEVEVGGGDEDAHEDADAVESVKEGKDEDAAEGVKEDKAKKDPEGETQKVKQDETSTLGEFSAEATSNPWQVKGKVKDIAVRLGLELRSPTR